MSRLEKTVTLLALLGGATMLAWGAWLPLKAALAQQLLHHAWQKSFASHSPVKPWPWADTWPVGKLILERLGVEEIILAGDSGEVLAFGPGLLPRSGKLGSMAHIVLAGHRDTSFAFLQDVLVGDRLTLQGGAAAVRYRVTDIAVMQASDLYFDPDEAGRLTLITCYPFAAIRPGTSQRFVVRAELEP
jgi:sortase A